MTDTAIDDLRRTSFDRNAAGYDAVRPSYPDALVDAALAGLPPAAKLLEIGAGTGKATVPFARRGARIVALEPGANMIAVLRANTAAFPAVACEQATFEAWSGADGSFDLVYAAQAIHWIDPAVRYVKIAAALRPGGRVAVIRNEKAPIDAALRAELDDAYARWFPPSDPPWPLDRIEREHVAELDAAARFGRVDVARFPWTQHYSAAEYLALIDTYSDHAVLEAARKTALYDAIGAAIERRGGISIPYVSMLFAATRDDLAA
jgi:SAM-dependent methyltransferase